jgi:hypothetical protein
LQGNYIGTDVTGTLALGNEGHGVDLGGHDNFVGGGGPGEGNVISGNGEGIFANCTTRDVVRGNFIGTDATGEVAIPNRLGIFFDGACLAEQNTIEQNVISGNLGLGLWFSEAGGPGSVRNTIRGNFIGTNRAGTAVIPNSGNGIQIDGGMGNVIGGSSSADRNIIAHNGGDGIAIQFGGPNTIRRNSIFGNVGLGIDLDDDGPTANDSRDRDTGSNDLQNFPELRSVLYDNARSQVTVRGVLNSTPNAAFTIDFYANEGAPALAEGKTWLGSITVRTDGSGAASINATLTNRDTRRPPITATATDAAGNTSEFSAAVSS